MVTAAVAKVRDEPPVQSESGVEPAPYQRMSSAPDPRKFPTIGA